MRKSHVQTMRELAAAVGLSRQALSERLHGDPRRAPKPTAKGHDVAKWRLYLARAGVQTKDVRDAAAQQTKGQAELKAENLQLKNELLKIDIAEAEGRLLPREKYLADLTTLGVVCRNGVVNCGDRLLAMGLTEAQRAEVSRSVQETLAAMRREVSAVKWDTVKGSKNTRLDRQEEAR